jgi:hypothetical protein
LSVKYETVLNMTTAKALGLDVPTSIPLSADERNTATQEDWIADGGNGSIATDEVEVTRSRTSASPLKADNLHTISASPLSARTGWEQSQQVALLLDHFVASRKIAASSALLMHRMPHQYCYLLRLTLGGAASGSR